MLTLGLIGICPSHGLRGATASTTAKQPVKVSASSRVHATTHSTSKRYRATQNRKQPKADRLRNITQQRERLTRHFRKLGYKVTIIPMTTFGYTPNDGHTGPSGRTRSGTPAIRGAVATDPRVISRGTALYIPRYGFGVARDTGGNIKGRRVDCCYATYREAKAHGRRSQDVYVLKPVYVATTATRVACR